MAAKPSKPSAPKAGNTTGQPGSIIESIQSEVSAEASPMLQFLANNARIIALALVLFIAGIAGYWIYTDIAEESRHTEITELGKILLIADAQTRLGQLESFAASAPDSVRRQTWYSIMEAANELKDYGKVYAAWKKIRGFDDSIRITATIGMADALSAQEKYKEALSVLESATTNINAASSPPVYSRILALAEHLGEYGRALGACDALLSKTTNQTDISLWTQKKALLEQKMAAAPK